MNLLTEPTPLLSVCYSFDDEWVMRVSLSVMKEQILYYVYGTASSGPAGNEE